LNMTKG